MIRTRNAALVTAACLVAASCASSADTPEPAASDSAPVETDSEPVATDAPVETDAVDSEPAATDAPVETEPVDTEAPAATEPPTTEGAPALPAEPQPITVQPAGTDAFVSSQSFDDTVAALTAAIEGNENLTLVASIDHAANAASVDIELPPTTVLIFGNPALGSPLMSAEASVGIDLPQKMLITEDVDGTVSVLWNRADYLSSRHALAGPVDEQLMTISGALRTLGGVAAAAAEDAAPTESDTVVDELGGIVETTAAGTAREAADRLIAAIDGNPALRLVAEIDHGANAANAGVELPAIIEVVFGNPNLGTPMMLASRTVAIDLPQKMLFIESDDGVRILYNDPTYIAGRHEIDTDVELVSTISGALGNLATAAAG